MRTLQSHIAAGRRDQAIDYMSSNMGVQRDRAAAVAVTFARGHRERDGDAHDEHEEGLDQVPESQAVPGVVGELRGGRLNPAPL